MGLSIRLIVDNYVDRYGVNGGRVNSSSDRKDLQVWACLIRVIEVVLGALYIIK